jgi:3-hydroxyacyl-[acyl-carrier-protein] dehydratase
MDYEQLLRQSRKKPVINLDDFDRVNYSSADIKKIIPHREPFLLVDSITGVNLTIGALKGSRFISPDDPVFKGHFPGFPVYPGALQIEMTGQLGLCLHYFLSAKSKVIAGEVKARQVRATRVLGAHFLEPLLPGQEVILVAKKLEEEGYFGTIIGQTISNGKICCVCISEVCFLD